MNATQPVAAAAAKTVRPRCFRATMAGVDAVTGKPFNAGAEIYKNPNGAGYCHLIVPVPAHLLPTSATA